MYDYFFPQEYFRALYVCHLSDWQKEKKNQNISSTSIWASLWNYRQSGALRVSKPEDVRSSHNFPNVSNKDSAQHYETLCDVKVIKNSQHIFGEYHVQITMMGVHIFAQPFNAQGETCWNVTNNLWAPCRLTIQTVANKIIFSTGNRSASEVLNSTHALM